MVKGLRWYEGKRLVSTVRGSDYAHAGEEEAISYCLAPYNKNRNRLILDAGCGQGGTAHFIQQQEWGQVTGCDIEDSSIQYAQKHYPNIKFVTADVVEVNKKLNGNHFDLICLFNSFYAFPDQSQALKSLHALGKENTEIIIFEYTDITPNDNNPLTIKNDPIKNFQPIRLDTIRQLTRDAGWECSEIKEINAQYKEWYRSFLNELKEKRENIVTQFTEAGYLEAINRYTKLYNAIENGILGGCIFYGKYIKT